MVPLSKVVVLLKLVDSTNDIILPPTIKFFDADIFNPYIDFILEYNSIISPYSNCIENSAVEVTANVYVSLPIVLSIKRGAIVVVGEPSIFIIFPFSCDFI